MGQYYQIWLDREHWTNVVKDVGRPTIADVLANRILELCGQQAGAALAPGSGVFGHPIPDAGQVLPQGINSSTTLVLEWDGESIRPAREQVASCVELAADNQSKWQGGASPSRDFMLISVSKDQLWTGLHEGAGRCLDALLSGESGSPRSGSPIASIVWAERGTSCWLVADHGRLLDPASLSSTRAAQIDQALRPTRRRVVQRPEPPTTSHLVDTVLGRSAPGELVRGGVFVLFGRNGSGKSMMLSDLQLAHSWPERHWDDQTYRGTEGNRVRVVLRWTGQAQHEPLFKLVLASVGWSPMSDDELRRHAEAEMPAWTSGRPRPPDHQGLAVAELIEKPLADLQESLARGWLASQGSLPTETLPSAIDAAAAVVASPILVLGWSRHFAGVRTISIAVDPGELSSEERETLASMARRLPPNRSRAALEALSEHRSDLVPVFEVALCHEGPAPAHRESGWPQASTEAVRLVGELMPRVVAISPSHRFKSGISAHVEQRTLDALSRITGDENSWKSKPTAAHPFHEAPAASRQLVEAICRLANSLLPAFIRSGGELDLSVAPQEMWHSERIQVHFLRKPDMHEYRIEDLPSGYRTWIAIAVDIACEQVRCAGWTASGGLLPQRTPAYGLPGFRPSDFIRSDYLMDPDVRLEMGDHGALICTIDEPEAHLHLTAQDDVVATIESLATGGIKAVWVASHSPSFLRMTPGRGEARVLTETPGGINLGRTGALESLQMQARELGIPAQSLAMQIAAVLLVEGPSDKRFLEKCFASELTDSRIHVMYMHGHKNFGIAEAQLLRLFGYPTYVMLDNIRERELLRAFKKNNPGSLTGEEQTLYEARLRLLEGSPEDEEVTFDRDDYVA